MIKIFRLYGCGVLTLRTSIVLNFVPPMDTSPSRHPSVMPEPKEADPFVMPSSRYPGP